MSNSQRQGAVDNTIYKPSISRFFFVTDFGSNYKNSAKNFSRHQKSKSKYLNQKNFHESTLRRILGFIFLKLGNNPPYSLFQLVSVRHWRLDFIDDDEVGRLSQLPINPTIKLKIKTWKTKKNKSWRKAQQGH